MTKAILRMAFVFSRQLEATALAVAKFAIVWSGDVAPHGCYLRTEDFPVGLHGPGVLLYSPTLLCYERRGNFPLNQLC